jgi:hypothetical protein
MNKSFLLKFTAILLLILFMIGCNMPGSNKSTKTDNSDNTGNPDTIMGQKVDIDNYTATTKEAQNVINKLKAGIIQ